MEIESKSGNGEKQEVKKEGRFEPEEGELEMEERGILSLFLNIF